VLNDLFLAVNAGMFVLMRLVQIIIYPGMHGWQHDQFVRLHWAYWRQIFCIVVPLILAQAALALLLFLQEPHPLLMSQIALMIFAWLITFAYSVPAHKRLQKGYNKRAVNRLVRTNWLRTIAWSVISLLDWIA